MKWDKKEWAYQHVHMFYGYLVCKAAIQLEFIFPILFSFLLGFVIECYQYYILEEDFYFFDRIRDLGFYVIGGVICLLLG